MTVIEIRKVSVSLRKSRFQTLRRFSIIAESSEAKLLQVNEPK